MKHRPILSICLSTVASVSILGLAVTPASAQGQPFSQDAQEEGRSAGDIVVTARKRSERLQDVPETITAFSADMLTKGGIANVDDLGRQLPNVILNRRGDNEPNVVIRGIGAFGNTQGVGFYVDDVRNITDQSARLVDLERLEVLKGPQGTLYGGSSIGGAIKFVTRKPSYEQEGHFTVEGGEQNILNVLGSVNVPIVDGVAALRISGYADHDGGYKYNPNLHVNSDKSTEYGFRTVLRLNPDDATEVLASFRYSRTENAGNDYYVTSGPQEYSFETPLSERNYNHKQILGGILSVTRDLDFATLTSLSSYTRRKNRILWDIDYTPADDVTASQDAPVVTKVFTQELRLASDNSGSLNWLAGVYYSSIRDLDLLSHVDLYLGAPAAGDPTVANYYNVTTLARQYAGFANIGWKSGGFEVNFGARLDHNKVKGIDLNTGGKNDTSDTIVLPKLSLAYHASRDLLLYASASKGYEPGRLNIAADAVLIPFKRETANNFEVGAKGELFGGLLQYDVAGFYIKYKDRQFETRINVDGIITEFITNIGTSESYGAEFSGTLRPTRDLSISASGGFLHSKWKKGVFFEQDVTGNTATNAPRFSGNINADYTHPVTDKLKVGLRGELTHTSSFYWDVPNLTKQRAYDIAGFRISLADIDDKWEFALRIDNAFNKVYNTEYQDQILSDRVNGACDRCSDARIGQPRVIKGSFSYKF
ncbi:MULTISPECIES: TonB-dependent receptor [unclassified Sphingobium]|uniref:TonB-dependent receptor n=1 Tax=unclassified Sphingobium TaxID=2611147 RepID=UPI0007703EDA|nr:MULTISPECIES: TonB-dependent receptor [unclassified Sphingobium]AMK24336.1 TonB-dependent receptor [Sphingobium sp. TKS]NML90407.1 TonB-dependent receptor [Sphingobium sp. TB-6]